MINQTCTKQKTKKWEKALVITKLVKVLSTNDAKREVNKPRSWYSFVNNQTRLNTLNLAT